MESRLQHIFLITALLTAFAAPTSAQVDISDDEAESVLEKVITPDLERRKIDESKIDSEFFELGFYAGVMSVEDFGTNSSHGIRAAFHITEDWFFETAVGFTNLSETSYETLVGGSDLLAENQREYYYYNLSMGLNIFPGEVFVLGKAFNIAHYIIAGVGNTSFADNEYFTYNFGAGYRIHATDWLAFRVELRHHMFTHNLFGEDKSVQNLETHVGFSLFF